MPLQDRLWTSISEVWDGFGVHVGTLWTVSWGSGGNSFGNVCAVEFLLDFYWSLSVGRGCQGGNWLKTANLPRHAFSDMFGVKEEGLVLEWLQFQDFPDTCFAERIGFQPVLS